MWKLTALLTTLALGSSASIALASPRNGHDTQARFVDPRLDRHRVASDRFDRDRLDRGRFDRDRLDRNRSLDDVGPRRYRSTWVALNTPRPLDRGRACIDVNDRGTFTQLRLQSDNGFAQVDRVIVQFADGSEQVARLDRDLDRRGEYFELPLDGNNRRIERIVVTGALGDLRVFAI